MVVLAGACQLLRPPAVGSLAAAGIQAVEVRFEPRSEDDVVPASTTCSDPEAIAALLAAIQPATEAREHKCGSCGVLVFRRSVGFPAELSFLPGHDPDWYELRYRRKIYRVPRAGFVEAMHRLGAPVPLDCGEKNAAGPR